MQFQFLAIEGNIGAGKTTLAKRLASIYQADLLLERFENNPFLSGFYKNPAQHALAAELFFLMERYEQIEAMQWNKALWISDFFLQKTLLFAHHTLDGHQFALFRRIFEQLRQKQAAPKQRIVYLHRPVDELLLQISERNRSYEQTIPAAYLTQVENAYRAHFSTQKTADVLWLDVTGQDLRGDSPAFEALKTCIETKAWVGFEEMSL